MADNVAITAGSGTTVSTEEVTTLNGGAVSAQHLQRVATAIRTADGTAVDLPGDSSFGLDVDVTRLPGPHSGLLGTPYTLVGKAVQSTTATTTTVWTPGSGKKIVVLSYQIMAGGTTAGNVQLWFGASADTTYNRGTDAALFDGEFAPSSTVKPGVVQSGLWISPTADYYLKITASAAVNPLTVVVWGYEV